MRIIKPNNINPTLLSAIKTGTANDAVIAQLLMSGTIAYERERFSHYSPVYRQTNEPFETYLKASDIEGKDILTVNGSGDFLTWIIQNNPASVSTFDINIFTDYYQYLKMGALLTLSYNEYLNFFYGNNVFNEKDFAKILTVLPKHVQDFWESLTNYFEPNEIIESELFVQNIVTIANARRYNSFLRNEESYLKAKKAAAKLCYASHNLDFNKLSEIKKKFDTIFISNIIDYQNYRTILEAVSKLRSQLSQNLKPNGVIIASTIGQRNMPLNVGPNASLKRASDSLYELRVKNVR